MKHGTGVILWSFLGMILGALCATSASAVTYTVTAQGETGAIAVAAGERHTVALKENGTMIAWGDNTFGQAPASPGVTDATAIAAGGYHTVALKADGTVVCWGDNTYGQSTPPAGLVGVTAIAAGHFHSVALKSDGTVVVWGRNDEGQLAVPGGLSGVTAIAAGYYHTLALKSDGSVAAWGWNTSGQTVVPAGLSGVTAIAAGSEHSLAVKSDGTVAAWGGNSYGQTDVPVGLAGVVEVAAGLGHSLALQSDGTMVGWGLDDKGQAATPTGLGGVSAIAAGGRNTLSLLQEGAIFMWGDNTSNQATAPTGLAGPINNGGVACGSPAEAGADSLCTFNPDPGFHLSRLSINGFDRLPQVSGNSYTIAAIQSDQIVTVGFAPNTLPEAPVIGTAVSGNGEATVDFAAPGWDGGSAITRYTVTASPGGATADGPASPIAISGLANGTAYTFTVQATNDVGTGPASASSNTVVPATVPDPPVIGTATAGINQATVTFTVPVSDGGRAITGYTATSSPGGVTASGSGSPLMVTGLDQATAYTFTVTATNGVGESPASQPSNTIVTPIVHTVTVQAVKGAAAIAAGTYNTVAITNDRAPAVWGSNGSGQKNIPAGLPKVMAIAEGDGHTVVIKEDGTVAAWGMTLYGISTVPEGLAGMTGVVAGYYHTVALKNDDTVVAWGENGYGQIAVPPGLTGVKAVAAGGFLSAAVRNDGTVAAWGRNDEGQVTWLESLRNVKAVAAGMGFALALHDDGTFEAGGDNTLGQTDIPAGLAVVTAIAAGDAHGLALRADGTVLAWGDDSSGQAAVPAGLSGVTAIAAAGDHSAALKADGTIVLWGANGSGQSTLPAGVGSLIDHGAITCDTPVIDATDSLCSVTPAAGYHLSIFTVNGADRLAAAAGGGYTITDIRADQLVAGEFALTTVPGPPIMGSATAGNGQASVTFTAPAADGGAPITGYTVTAAPGGLSANGSSSPIVISGLSNGTSYTFTVRAINAIGQGPDSAVSNPVVPATVPGAPVMGSAVAGFSRATVTFTAPAADGGSPITHYTVTASPGGASSVGSASPITVTGLNGGIAYTFTVTATNGVGTGPVSAASAPVTPMLSDTRYGSVIDAPHNQASGIGCSDCHSYALWWSYSPLTSTDPDYGQKTDLLCLACHGTGPGAIAAGHSSAAMGTAHNPAFGNWSTKCLDCHDPHLQAQLAWRRSDSANLYLASGTIASVTPGEGGETVIGYSGLTVNSSGWDPVVADWGWKNPAGPPSGLILVEDTQAAVNTYQVLAVNPGSATVTVKGDMDPAAVGKGFGVIFGGMIRGGIDTATGIRNVKFFDPNLTYVAGAAGGLVDSANGTLPQGVCQVCHTLTQYWTGDGGGTGHHDGTACLACHDLRQGFRP